MAKFSLEQEVVDKTGTKKIFHCKNYEKNETEDDCLNNCLVKTFVEEFGCLHSRLKVGKSHFLAFNSSKNEQKMPNSPQPLKWVKSKNNVDL